MHTAWATCLVWLIGGAGERRLGLGNSERPSTPEWSLLTTFLYSSLGPAGETAWAGVGLASIEEKLDILQLLRTI